ncbi:MAG: glycosyltransferase family 4 protein [Candidatus Sedimenticola sp. (ex Thyasira tokunagai)]
MRKVIILTGKPINLQNSGAEIRNFAIAEALKQDFELTCVSVTTEKSAITDHPNHFSLTDLKPEKSRSRPKPFSISYTYTESAVENLYRLVDKISPDLVVAETLSCAPYILKLRQRDIPVILDMHNDEVELSKQIEASIPAFRKIRCMRERYKHHKTEQWQGDTLAASSHIWCCSQIDANSLTAKEVPPEKITIIPNPLPGYFEHILPIYDEIQSRALFVGALSYPPNHSGIMWFIEKVAPLVRTKVPDFQLDIIGRSPRKSLRRAVSSSTYVHGHFDVNDLTPFYTNTRLCIVPLFEGSGTRIKILEAAEAGRPIISTTKGAEGIDQSLMKHLLLADNPERFAEFVCRVINDDITNKQFGDKLRQGFERHHSRDLIRGIINADIERIINA